MGPQQPADESLVFYDIASAPPKRTFAPNPWKTRLALNFKAASYTTAWVELPDVASTRKALGVPAARKFPDGSDFHTLPILHDGATKQFFGDSFEIALYLDDKYSDGPRLVAPGTAGVTKAWNDRVDQLFTRFATLCVHGTPLNPDNAEVCRQILLSRGQAFYSPDKGRSMTWDDWAITGESRAEMLAEFETALGELDTYYSYAGTETRGSFLSGQKPTYADLIVGGWLGYVHETLAPGDLAEFQKWHDGRWGNMWKALAKYADCSR